MKGKRGRPRKYRHDIRCPECGSNWCVRNGHHPKFYAYKWLVKENIQKQNESLFIQSWLSAWEKLISNDYIFSCLKPELTKKAVHVKKLIFGGEK
jgi:hypothetical protein